MASAFYELRRRTSTDFPAGASLPIHVCRERIRSALPLHIQERDVLVKRLPSIAINLSAERFRAWAEVNGVRPWIDPLLPLFYELGLQADAVARCYTSAMRTGIFGSRDLNF